MGNNSWCSKTCRLLPNYKRSLKLGENKQTTTKKNLLEGRVCKKNKTETDGQYISNGVKFKNSSYLPVSNIQTEM